MAEQVNVLGVKSLPNIVSTNHEMLAVEPNLLAPADHLSLAKHRNQGQLLTSIRHPHDGTHVVSGLW